MATQATAIFTPAPAHAPCPALVGSMPGSHRDARPLYPPRPAARTPWVSPTFYLALALTGAGVAGAKGLGWLAAATRTLAG